MTIDFDKGDGLVPAIIQDDKTHNVLMLGYMNREAYDRTIATGKVTFFSRSRKTLWTKGETSGNYLDLVSIKTDCDNDTLLVRVNPTGPVCHTGTDTCWGESNALHTAEHADSPLLFLARLQDIIEQRHSEMPDGSYTTTLFRDGINRMAQKVGEEALETVIEAVNGNNERLVYEASDLLYHLMVLLTSKQLRIEDIAQELCSRHSPQWKKH